MSEKLGVFEGNIEFAELVYDRLLEEFKKEYGRELERDTSGETIRNISGRSDFLKIQVTDIYDNILRQKIEKWKLKIPKFNGEIYFILDLYSSKNDENPEGLSKKGAKFNLDPYYVPPQAGTEEGELTFGALITYIISRNSHKSGSIYPNRLQDILDYLIEKKVEIIRTISHETKHLIDTLIGTRNKSNQKEYEVITWTMQEYMRKLISGGTPSTDKLFKEILMDLYFINKAENLVRPTEIAAHMKLTGVKKEEFISFLDQNPIVKRLREMSKRSYSELRNVEPNELRYFLGELLNQTENTLSGNMINIFRDREKMTNPHYEYSADHYVKYSYSDFFRKDLDNLLVKEFGKKYNVILKNMTGDTKKYSDEEIKNKSEKLFSDIEKKVREESQKILRKIYKLYDLAA